MPGNLRFTSETQAPEAWLQWDFATDNFDNGINIQYEVFVNGVRAEEATVIGWDSTIAYCRTSGPNTFAVRCRRHLGQRLGVQQPARARLLTPGRESPHRRAEAGERPVTRQTLTA